MLPGMEGFEPALAIVVEVCPGGIVAAGAAGEGYVVGLGERPFV